MGYLTDQKKYESVDVRILELIISCPIMINSTGETSKERKKVPIKEPNGVSQKQ